MKNELRIPLASCLLGLPLSAAEPSFVLPDDPVLRGDAFEFRLVGLEPNAEVTVRAERIWGRGDPKLHRAEARFRADEHGEVDFTADAPVAMQDAPAPWSAADPSAFLWSATPTDAPVEEGRSSTLITFEADTDDDGTPDATGEMVSVRSIGAFVETPLGDDLPGAFLLRPEGDDILPVIVALGGSEGNDSSARTFAPKMASRGYAVIGLPYYSPAYWGQTAKFPELPRAFHNIPIDSLETVAEWVRTRPDLDEERIGLYGGSKGAEFVLAGASRIEGFRAVVAMVPSDVIWEAWGPGTVEGESSCFSWRGAPLPFVPYEGMNEEIAKYSTNEPVRIRTPHDKGRAAHPDAIAAARIRVEAIDEPVMVVGGDRDDVWDSGGMSRTIKATRDGAGLETIMIVDPEARHNLSGDPWTPSGDPVAARVRRRAFPAMLDLFERCLKP